MSSSMQIIEYGIVDEDQLPYENPRYLGHGHSGAVHAVQHRVTKALYAQKTLRISGHPRENTEETFLNEVRIIRGLESHRHIVRVHATYLSTLYFGILLEPVASEGDLEAYLAKYARQRDSNISANILAHMRFVLQRGFGCLAAGLAFMHERSVRHKDIKPRNILVHNDILLYTDFGYSWDSSGLDTSMTEGPPSGITRKFSAPEVLKPEQRNSKSDVYSLGCVFILILSTLDPTLLFDSRQHFSDMMNGIHNQLDSMKLPVELAALPTIIAGMTDHEASSRLCSAHATYHLLQRSNLCCLQCASSDNKDWTERGKDDTCVPPPSLSGLAVAGQAPNASRNLTGPVSGDIESKEGGASTLPASSQQTQASFDLYALDPIRVHNRSGLLTPGLAYAEGSTTFMPGQISAGYKKRTGQEANIFFCPGRVFSVLQPEAISQRSFPGDTVSVDRGLNRTWGTPGAQPVVRRFIIVKASKRQQFIYACEISTYGGRATLDLSCNASEHAVVHVFGTEPVYLSGEHAKGMCKDPIAIELEDQTIRYEPTSRLNLGRTQTFDWSIMAQLHGCVVTDHMTRLIGYYRQEQRDGLDRNDD